MFPGLGALRPHFRIHKAVDVVAPDCTVTMIGNQLTCSQLEDMYVYTGKALHYMNIIHTLYIFL